MENERVTDDGRAGSDLEDALMLLRLQVLQQENRTGAAIQNGKLTMPDRECGQQMGGVCRGEWFFLRGFSLRRKGGG